MAVAKPTRKNTAKTPRRGDLAPDRIAAILKGRDEAYPQVECALSRSWPGTCTTAR